MCVCRVSEGRPTFVQHRVQHFHTAVDALCVAAITRISLLLALTMLVLSPTQSLDRIWTAFGVLTRDGGHTTHLVRRSQ